MTKDAVEHVAFRVGLVDLREVHISRHGGEERNVLMRQDAHQAGLAVRPGVSSSKVTFSVSTEVLQAKLACRDLNVDGIESPRRDWWSQTDVWFFQVGTLLATAEGFVKSLSRGYFADERVRAFHAEARKTHCIN